MVISKQNFDGWIVANHSGNLDIPSLAVETFRLLCIFEWVKSVLSEDNRSMISVLFVAGVEFVRRPPSLRSMLSTVLENELDYDELPSALSSIKKMTGSIRYPDCRQSNAVCLIQDFESFGGLWHCTALQTCERAYVSKRGFEGFHEISIPGRDN